MLGALIILAALLLGFFIEVSFVETLPKAANDSVAASSLRILYLANVDYAKNHPLQGYAARLSDLSEVPANPEHSWAIDPALAGGEKHGYRFAYTSQGTQGDGKRDVFQASADPLVPGKTGRHHFFVDQTGVIRMSDTKPADAASVPIQ
jgi:hypothetical protein